MAEKEKTIKEKVESTGLFDFPGFYKYANSWFKDNEYGVNEEKYIEKEKYEGIDEASKRYFWTK